MKTLLKISTLLLVMIISPLFISNTHASTSCEWMDDAMTITVSEDLSPLYCWCET